MPVLDNARREMFAQLVARGATVNQAGKDAGYVGRTNFYRLTKVPAVQDRIREIKEENDRRSAAVTVHHRKWIDGEMRRVYDRCMTPIFEGQPCPVCQTKIEKIADIRIRHAVKLLEMFGLEQGMFKRQLDVTSRKSPMIEGSQTEILDKFAQLLERLGIPAMEHLFSRLPFDSMASAMGRNGYELTKGNGKTHDFDSEPASGDAGDAPDSRDADALALPSAPEAGGLP